MATMPQSRDGKLTTTGVNSLTKAAPPIFPFPSHRSVAQADAQAKQREQVLTDLANEDDWGFERRDIGRSMARSNKRFLAALGAEVRA